MNEWYELLDSLQRTGLAIGRAIPAILSVLLVLMVGWALARVGRRATIRVARLLRLDAVAEQVGIEGFLVQGGVEFTAVTLLGGAVYWGILFLTFVVLLNLVTDPAGTELLEQIVRFVPRVVVAVIVLVFGSVVSRFVGTVTFTYLSNVGSKAANGIAAIARFAMLTFVIALAVEQLAQHSEILVSGFQIVFGALCLALALAFGLGGRDWAARVLERSFKP